MLDLIGSLLVNLNAQEVPYCHWKGNYSLAQALAGDKDLEILVQPTSLPQARAILKSLGFKKAEIRVGPTTPSAYHYYGLDQHTGRLVHVHLYSRTVTGERFVDSHLLPFESMLLENPGYMGQVRVASKPAELVTFILRTYIRFGSVLDLIYLLRHSEKTTTELRWLSESTDLSEAVSLLRANCPVMEESLFVNCIDTLNGSNSQIKRMLMAQEVRRRLSIYARHTATSRLLEYARLTLGVVKLRLRRGTSRKALRTGGKIIAFVGPDATGKSTLAEECGRWLGNVFDVRLVHAGKPPPSWLTLPFSLVLPLARRLWPRLRATEINGHGQSKDSDQPPLDVGGLSWLIYGLRAAMIAWDRRRLLLQTSRRAAGGQIVVCDRYPSDTVGAMDSPRLLENGTQGGLLSATHNRLAQLERRLYEQIPSPDIVLRLSASVGTAKWRNRNRIKSDREIDAYLESRHGQSQEWRRTGTKHIYDIDTEQPLGETILSVKRAIWESL